MSWIKAYYIMELSLEAFYFADGSRTITNMHIVSALNCCYNQKARYRRSRNTQPLCNIRYINFPCYHVLEYIRNINWI